MHLDLLSIIRARRVFGLCLGGAVFCGLLDRERSEELSTKLQSEHENKNKAKNDKNKVKKKCQRGQAEKHIQSTYPQKLKN